MWKRPAYLVEKQLVTDNVYCNGNEVQPIVDKLGKNVLLSWLLSKKEDAIIAIVIRKSAPKSQRENIQ